jgi:hypothetical protein
MKNRENQQPAHEIEQWRSKEAKASQKRLERKAASDKHQLMKKM